MRRFIDIGEGTLLNIDCIQSISLEKNQAILYLKDDPKITGIPTTKVLTGLEYTKLVDQLYTTEPLFNEAGEFVKYKTTLL